MNCYRLKSDLHCFALAETPEQAAESFNSSNKQAAEMSLAMGADWLVDGFNKAVQPADLVFSGAVAR